MSFAFLDIETSWERTITVVGVYRPGRGTVQLVAPAVSRARLLEILEGVTDLFTYNGSGFDLPVIERHLGLPLHEHHRHRDLMFDCWRRKLKGGLKAVERTLGIHRDSEGIDGLAAMRLWATHHRGCLDVFRESDASSASCCEALEVLLRYNREDCENLETLAMKLGVLSSDGVLSPLPAKKLSRRPLRPSAGGPSEVPSVIYGSPASDRGGKRNETPAAKDVPFDDRFLRKLRKAAGDDWQ